MFIYIFPQTGSLEVRLNSTLLISYLYPDLEIWDTASGPLPLAVIKSLTITAELCQGFSLYVMWFLCVIFLQELSDKIIRLYSRTKKPKRFKSNKFCHYVVITLASFICYIMVKIKKILSKELKRSKNKLSRKKGKGQQPDMVNQQEKLLQLNFKICCFRSSKELFIQHFQLFLCFPLLLSPPLFLRKR